MKDTTIFVQNLALELTRKCNLTCNHCMRGTCQDKVMSNETMERIFEDIDGTMQLQFIGGETSLALDRLKKLEEILREKQTKARSILVFTNAVDISNDYIETLGKLKDYVKERNNLDKDELSKEINTNYKGIIPRVDERNYALRVIVSLDKFHLDAIDRLAPMGKETVRQKVKNNIEKLANYFPVEIDKMCNFSIYNEGRGKIVTGMYKQQALLDNYALMYWKMKEDSGLRDLLLVGPILGISYDGKIIEVNKDYEYIDQHAIGDIHKEKESFFQMCKHLKTTKGFKQCKDVDPLYKRFGKISHRLLTSTKELLKMQKFYKKNKTYLDFSYFTKTGVEGYEELDDKQDISKKVCEFENN